MSEIVEPTVDEHGYETHPAWGMISVHRSQVMGTGGGAVLFDSDIRHRNVVSVRLCEASRRRNLNHDHKMAGRVLHEVMFSEAQWASFIASTNQGDGVPCTIESRGGERMPGMPFEPRLQESLDEVRAAAEHSMELIREAFERVKEKPNKGNIRHLEAMLDNAPSNMEFAAKSLEEHAENVVQKTRQDIEAMALTQAQRLGIDPAQLGVRPELTSGDVVDDG